MESPAANHQPVPASSARRLPLLIVGLRNPNRTYANSRHNAGAMAVERLAGRHGISINQGRGNVTVGHGAIEGADVTLALPRTFMNVSGEAVGPLVRRSGTRLSRLLVVYDDMDLPLGKVRLRPYGSAGGHNGMRSVIAALGTDRFPRLRIGIGRPERMGQDTIGYVLGAFRPEERDRLDEALNRAAECMETLIAENLERAMNKFN